MTVFSYKINFDLLKLVSIIKFDNSPVKLLGNLPKDYYQEAKCCYKDCDYHAITCPDTEGFVFRRDEVRDQD